VLKKTFAEMNKKDRDSIDGLIKKSDILLWLARSQKNRAGWCAALRWGLTTCWRAAL
jgi:hypothetical protein